MDFSINSFQTIVPKPWGQEIIFTSANLTRTGKILQIKAGKRLSLQYHDQKEETLCLLSGNALLWLENSSHEIEKIPMEAQKGYTIVPMQKHRIESVTDCTILEVSSPETGTTVRVEDDFNRPDETEDLRSAPNRGWTK